MAPAKMDHRFGTVSEVWHNLDIPAFQFAHNVTTNKSAFSSNEHFHS
jgi:hypothetical protein